MRRGPVGVRALRPVTPRLSTRLSIGTLRNFPSIGAVLHAAAKAGA